MRFVPTFLRRKALLLAVLPAAVSPVFAGQPDRPGAFFVSASSSIFYTPRLFSEFIEPRPGFRGALGYGRGRFSVAAESGFTQVAGTNPLVLNIDLVPVVIRAGYALPLFARFGLKADLGAGVVFSNVIHYEDVVGMLTGRRLDSRERTPVAGGRLHLTFDMPLGLRLYAGGGMDALFENDGPIPMPLVQGGVSFRPAARPRPVPAPLQPAPAPLPYAPVPLPHAPPPLPPPPVAVRFPPECADVYYRYMPALYGAAALLHDNPSFGLTLRGYTAPFGTAAGRAALSYARARSVMLYLTEHRLISPQRITVKHFGADEMPELADGTHESRRTVTLVITPVAPAQN